MAQPLVTQTWERRLQALERREGLAPSPPGLGLQFTPDGRVILPGGTIVHGSIGLVPGSAPPAPSGLNLTPGADAGDIWVDVDWTPAAANTAGPVTAWAVEVLRDGDTLPIVHHPTADLAPPTQAYRVHNLEPNQLYHFTVRAITQLGASSTGLTGDATTGHDTAVPSTPSGLVATVGLKTITATWTALGTTLAPFQGKYFVDLATNNTFTTGLRTFDNGDSNVISIGDLTTGQTYYLRVKARSSSGVDSASYATSGALTPGAALTVDINDLAITGPKIAPAAVTTEKLTVGSVSANAVLNGTFEDGTDADAERAAQWTYDYDTTGSGVTYDLTGASPKITGDKSLRLIGLTTTNGKAVASNSIPVNVGDVWYIVAKARASTTITQGFSLQAYFGTAKDFAIGSALSHVDIAANVGLSSVATFDGQVTVPTSAVWMRIVARGWQPNVSCNIVVDDVAGRKVTVSAQIADGAITTPKMVAGTIDADRLVAASVTAGLMAANSITAANGAIANLAVTNAKINDVSAGKLTAGTIGAYLIQLASGGTIRNTGYSAGSSGWNIDGAGNAEFNNVTIRGVLAAASFASTDFTFYDSGGLHMLRLAHISTSHWLQLGDGIASGAGLRWDATLGRYFFEGGTANSPAFTFTPAVNIGGTLYADGSIAVGGAAYAGGVFANTGSGVADPDWGLGFDHPGAGIYSTELRYHPIPGNGDNRRSGIYDANGADWVFYADNETDCYSRTSWTVFSSKTLKKLIRPASVTDGDALLALKPVRYRLKKGDESRQVDRFGLLAEDVQPIIPEVVSRSGPDDPLGVDYTALIPLLVMKIQDQEARIAAMEKGKK